MTRSHEGRFRAAVARRNAGMTSLAEIRAKEAEEAAAAIEAAKPARNNAALAEAMGIPGAELAGDRMTINHRSNGTMEIAFDDKGTGRVCGSCQLCCRLMPVPGIEKPQNTRCRHQSYAKGCRLHESPTFPVACRLFVCGWLADPTTRALRRPDRSHYVIDLATDYVRATDRATGEELNIPVFQIWCDPAFPDAHKDPDLRQWMIEMARSHRAATIVRLGPTRALTVLPPSLNADGQWHEERGTVLARNESEAAILNNFARGGIDGR